MDRRTLLALLLTAIVIVATPMLFPSPKRAPQRVRDSSATRIDSFAAPSPAAAEGVPTRTTAPVAPPPQRMVAAETTVVRTTRAVYAIVSPGGTPPNLVLPDDRPV